MAAQSQTTAKPERAQMGPRIGAHRKALGAPVSVEGGFIDDSAPTRIGGGWSVRQNERPGLTTELLQREIPDQYVQGYRMQIIVLGMHRSGTSLITRLVNMMGAYVGAEGTTLPIEEDNPKGYWERKDVVDINDALIGHVRRDQEFTCNWKNIADFGITPLDSIPADLKRRMRHMVMEIDAHRPWIVKDPRVCLTLGCWLPYLEVPVALIAWRNPMEIARSLQKRDGTSIEHGLAIWEYYIVHLIRHSHALPKVFATHAAMLATPVEGVCALHEGLIAQGVRGLRIPSRREILAFIDPKLHHEREPAISHPLSLDRERLCAMMRGEIAFEADVQVSSLARHIMEGAESADPPRSQ